MNFSLYEQRTLLAMVLRDFHWVLPVDTIHEDGLKNALSTFALNLPENLELEFSKLPSPGEYLCLMSYSPELTRPFSRTRLLNDTEARWVNFRSLTVAHRVKAGLSARGSIGMFDMYQQSISLAYGSGVRALMDM